MKIKPCPFCGHKAEILKDYRYWFIWCINSKCLADLEMKNTNKSHVIKAWNRRVKC